MAASELDSLLRTLDPRLHEGVYVYSLLPRDVDPASLPVIASFREEEGMTVILPETRALESDLPILFRAAWITLNVQSDLAAVGLTAAISRVLADAGISCNVVAAAHHDHLFVPFDRARDAVERLTALQRETAGGSS